MARLWVMSFAAIGMIAAGCQGSAEPGPSSSASEGSAHQQRLLDRWDLEPYDPALDEFTPNEAFHRYFEPLGVLRLSDSLLVNYVTALDFDDAGNILMLDMSGGEVILFGRDGSVLKKLDPQECHPGYEFKPMFAGYTTEGDILVYSNYIPAGFRFESDGTCGQAIDLYSIRAHGIATDVSGGVFVYSTGSKEWKVYRVDANGDSLVVHQGTRNSQLNDRYRGRFEMTSVGGRYAALVQRHSPLVTLIDSETNAVRTVGFHPPYYREVTEEANKELRNWADVSPELGRITEGKSATSGVWALTDSIVIVGYMNNYLPLRSAERYAMEIIHTSGRRENAESIMMPFFQSAFVGARDGLLFRYGSNYDTNRPFDSNPGIIVYKYRPD